MPVRLPGVPDFFRKMKFYAKAPLPTLDSMAWTQSERATGGGRQSRELRRLLEESG
jgi:hypothetical protein